MGRTTVQALLECIVQSDWLYRHEPHDNGQLKPIFLTFKESSFNTITTSTAFNNARHILQPVKIYVFNTWLNQWKQKLVIYSIDRLLHFEIKAMSRAEGLRHTLKSYLEHSQLSLFEVWKRMKIAVDWQIHTIEVFDAWSRDGRPTNLLSNLLYYLLLNQIFIKALNLV